MRIEGTRDVTQRPWRSMHAMAMVQRGNHPAVVAIELHLPHRTALQLPSQETIDDLPRDDGKERPPTNALSFPLRKIQISGTYLTQGTCFGLQHQTIHPTIPSPNTDSILLDAGIDDMLLRFSSSLLLILLLNSRPCDPQDNAGTPPKTCQDRTKYRVQSWLSSRQHPTPLTPTAPTTLVRLAFKLRGTRSQAVRHRHIPVAVAGRTTLTPAALFPPPASSSPDGVPGSSSRPSTSVACPPRHQNLLTIMPHSHVSRLTNLRKPKNPTNVDGGNRQAAWVWRAKMIIAAGGPSTKSCPRASHEHQAPGRAFPVALDRRTPTSAQAALRVLTSKVVIPLQRALKSSRPHPSISSPRPLADLQPFLGRPRSHVARIPPDFQDGGALMDAAQCCRLGVGEAVLVAGVRFEGVGCSRPRRLLVCRRDNDVNPDRETRWTKTGASPRYQAGSNKRTGRGSPRQGEDEDAAHLCPFRAIRRPRPLAMMPFAAHRSAQIPVPTFRPPPFLVIDNTQSITLAVPPFTDMMSVETICALQFHRDKQNKVPYLDPMG
ncbi:hypothetical protein CPLU01_06307 [Colletotrichum plurivorum]|uniref:Uncharacterized protein n=1 Tax=Colletotrichum plurivorum TaxID=2175906 RepID=A0A8H6KJP0_9PEZI|nr:hypothetical protein CPLU01_06307 [Colletotrichum plurivorum]